MEFHTDIYFLKILLRFQWYYFYLRQLYISHEKYHIIVIVVVCPSVRIYNNNNYDMLFFMWILSKGKTVDTESRQVHMKNNIS